MTDTTRRGFFRLLAGAAIAPVIAKAEIFSNALTFWGDGLHDDTAALQALIDGEVVEFANAAMAHGAGWFGATLMIPKGEYLITDTIKINQPTASESLNISFQGSQLTAGRPLDAVIRIEGGKSVHVDGCLFWGAGYD